MANRTFPLDALVPHSETIKVNHTPRLFMGMCKYEVCIGVLTGFREGVCK